ncbi:MAG: aminotransferase class V-fold PLP-dependent enzyme, partial [Bryobacteraceae bacterium]|nr:aminotransferase class V-fold PLP-dependent enzyme [Bryobacteraceae bacterium]
MQSDRQPDWEQIRREFPALAGCTYLNTATFGQTPRRGVEAVARHFERRNAHACSDFLDWFNDVDRMRASVASLIHAQPEDIAFVNTASAALALLMNGLEWRKGDRILALAGEFPNNLYFPAALSVLGVEFVETERDQIESLLDERVRLVLMSTVNYATGFRPPLEPLAAKLRDLGALFYVDGTQSVGALQFDVRTVQPDMLAVHAYKWMLSPNGAAFAYVAPHLRESLRPTVVGWRSDRGWRNVDHLHHGSPDFADGAEKYEGGMVNFP